MPRSCCPFGKCRWARNRLFDRLAATTGLHANVGFLRQQRRSPIAPEPVMKLDVRDTNSCPCIPADDRHTEVGPKLIPIGTTSNVMATSNGREMIGDFRLRGSRTCRGMDAPLRNEGWRVGVAREVARPFNNPNAPLSEGEVLAVVVQVVPGNPHWTRVGTDCPNPMG